MLKMTSIKLDLISVTDMYFFVEKKYEKRCLFIIKRCSKANKYMKSYHDSKQGKYITYFDQKHLYDWAMT